MNTYFLYFFDQLRAILGILLGSILVCLPSIRRRNYFFLRLLLCIAACTVQASLWLLIFEKMQTDYFRYSYWGFVHLIGNSIIVVLEILICFEISPSEAIFRCIIGKIMETTLTVFLRNILIYLFFENLPAEHFFIYLGVMALSYFLIYGFLFRKTIEIVSQGNPSAYFDSNSGRVVYFAGIYISITVIVGLIQTICERLITPLSEHEQFQGLYIDIYVFSLLSLLLICALIITTLVRFYRLSVLESENSLLEQLLADKAEQYSFIRENVEVINGKCHELRKQLKRLEDNSDVERSETIREISRALNFYDSTVKTGNEVLDTILTEKSLLCANRGIKLSCMINSDNIRQIDTMDLYTILDIALDGAIRYESSLQDKEKKLISFMLTNVGSMMYIVIENYYEPDTQPYSGIDLKKYRKDRETIRRIAKRYQGEIQTNKENNVYQFQIILPAVCAK